jgi:CubicO group peptidase (beta-lactamase class C family)
VSAEQLGFDPQRLSRVGARMDAEISNGRYDGAALIVARKGQIALRTIHGYADRGAERKLKDNDVFATMSLGKQFTAVVVLNRIERGELHLHMRVCDVIPEFRDNGMRTMSLFHLLTHTSGIESEWPSVPLETLVDIGKLTAYAASRRPDSTPGERVSYSTMVAHSVMAEMVRRVDKAGRSFTQIVTQDLFEPLKMNNTSMGPRADLLARLCPIRPAFQGPGVIAPEALLNVAKILSTEKAELGAGGYMTTLDDVHRFATMLRNGGELDGARILSPRTLAYCTQNFTGEKTNSLFDYTRESRGWEPWPASMGIGFWVRGEGIQPGPMSNFSSPRAYGAWGAGSTGFWVDPEMDLTFSFLSVGIMEATDHLERVQRLADLVIAALVE